LHRLMTRTPDRAHRAREQLPRDVKIAPADSRCRTQEKRSLLEWEGVAYSEVFDLCARLGQSEFFFDRLCHLNVLRPMADVASEPITQCFNRNPRFLGGAWNRP